MSGRRCCERCAAVYRWTYRLGGDGDGVEFLVEVGHLVDGGESTRTVVFVAPGVRESQ